MSWEDRFVEEIPTSETIRSFEDRRKDAVTPSKLHKRPISNIFIFSYCLLLLAVSVLQYPAILIFAGCAFMVSPTVLTLKHPEFTIRDVMIRLSACMLYFVLPILSLTTAFGIQWQLVLPVLLLQTFTFLTAPIMIPKSMRAKLQKMHA
jgi:hypothetical protein